MSIAENRTRILTPDQIQIKLQRIAFELLENHYQEPELIVLGVNGTGETIAQLLGELMRNHQMHCQIGTVHINKKEPLSAPVSYSIPVSACHNKTVVFVDDVANSGRTLFYAMNPLMHTPLKSISVVVLIDRRHKQFPITADYVGLSISTGLQEHILVEPAGDKAFEAFLE